MVGEAIALVRETSPPQEAPMTPRRWVVPIIPGQLHEIIEVVVKSAVEARSLRNYPAAPGSGLRPWLPYHLSRYGAGSIGAYRSIGDSSKCRWAPSVSSGLSPT